MNTPVRTRPEILLGTVLLERNRWSRERVPSFAVSDWTVRAKAAGFDGLELWEHHAVDEGEVELATLCAGPLPTRVFNSYVRFDAAGAVRRQVVADAIRRLKAPAVKFNLGHDPAGQAAEVGVARDWFATLPGVQPLCECHPGSSVETPAVAAAAFCDWPEVAVIAHAFSTPLDTLAAWLAAFGPRVRHVHAQGRDGSGRWLTLRQHASEVQAALTCLRRHGYAGSFTIEFTEGVAAQPEDREQLFAAACQDLADLRAWWAAGIESGTGDR